MIKLRDGRHVNTPAEAQQAPGAGYAWYEEGRAYGRFEADSALNWQTTCVTCAGRLSDSAGAFFDGERSGIAAALRAIREATSDQTTIQEIIDVLAGKLERLLDAHRPLTAGDAHGPCDHVRTEQCVTPERPTAVDVTPDPLLGQIIESQS